MVQTSKLILVQTVCMTMKPAIIPRWVTGTITMTVRTTVEVPMHCIRLYRLQKTKHQTSVFTPLQKFVNWVT